MASDQDDRATAALAEFFGALSHPLRIRVLRHYAGGEKLSARRLTDLMPESTLGTLAYHVRELASAGLLKPAGQIPRRGAIEHLYLLTPRGKRAVTLLDELPRGL
jgi:DNA-binding transcriptional ArsR family regulator